METRTKYLRDFECEVRAEADDERGQYITGQPVVFDSVYDVWGMYGETIERGALDDADLKDVRFLINHNTDMIPLARSRNNNANSTMQLERVEGGLNIRANLDTENNETARSLYSAVSRGDISGMSFMFTIKEDRWTDLDSDYPVRHITAIDRVFEVSAVIFPAYEETTIEARADAQALESARAALESERAKAEAEARAEKMEAIKNILEGKK